MGFTELTRKPIDLCKPKPRNQFGYLSKNAVLCLKSKNTIPLCDENDSLKDMDIINKLIASSKSNGKVIKV